MDVVVAESVPGANDLTMGYNDEHFLVRTSSKHSSIHKAIRPLPSSWPIFPPHVPFLCPQVPVGGTVQCVGAALAVVVATSAQVARQAARKVQATYEPLRDEQVGSDLLLDQMRRIRCDAVDSITFCIINNMTR